MIKKEARYITSDGKEFKDLKKAQDHQVDQICEIFDKELKGPRFTSVDIFNILTSVFRDYDKLIKIYSEMQKIIEPNSYTFKDDISECELDMLIDILHSIQGNSIMRLDSAEMALASIDVQDMIRLIKSDDTILKEVQKAIL